MKFEISNNLLYITYSNQSLLLTLQEATELRDFLEVNKEKLRPNKKWDECWKEDHLDSCDCMLKYRSRK